ncbi:hypothetical protein GGR50DRAFT_440911 [Xylaria sp. CBS 124048]|nr:hypothetical protein GGR50DRAFT_440911 [Xylaria sp. CBS 124048]
MILEGIRNGSKPVWQAAGLDEFVSNLTRILWPDVLYELREMIFIADDEAMSGHLDDYKGDCGYCRHSAYRICTTEILAAVLDNCKIWDDLTRTIRNQRAIRWTPANSKLSQSQADLAALEPKLPPPITKKSEFPIWVRCPDLLHGHLSEDVIEIIRELGESYEEPVWHLRISTGDRVSIIVARIQRLFHRRVRTAVENRRPVSALCYVFDERLTTIFHTRLGAEIDCRRRQHPSVWHQTHGVWAVAKRVLVEVLNTCEDAARETRPSIVGRVQSWIGAWFGLGQETDQAQGKHEKIQ